MFLNLKIRFLLVSLVVFTNLWTQFVAASPKSSILVNESNSTGSSSSYELYDLSFQNINDFGQFKASTLKGKKSFWIVFQRGCQSCRSQFKDLNCLPTEIQKVAIGLEGTREDLVQELKPTKFSGYAIQSSAEFKKRFSIKGTPTLLFVNEEGRMMFQSLALKKCNDILSQFKNFN